jgi:hypothetical protein
MVDQPAVTATTTTEAAPAVEETLLGTSDQPVVSENESVLDTAGAEEKAAREVEDKRILEANDKDLKPEEVTRKAELVKTKQAEADKKLAEIKAKGVPEKYEIKPPEGYTLDEKALSKVTPVFKEIGLSNAQAQRLSDYYSQIQQEKIAENEATLKNWREENAKETMSALGANAKTELVYVGKVKNMLSAETIEALNASGIGNMKHFIYDMAKIGKLFSEEHLVRDNANRAPNSQGETREDVAHKLYPTMQQQ